MPEHAPPGPVRRPGLLGWIALLPGVLIGFCLGAWMLAITLEWLGEAFFWRNTCASHSEQVLQATWQGWKSSAGAPMWLVEDLAIVSDTLQQGLRRWFIRSRAKRVVLDGNHHYGDPLCVTVCE